MSGAWNKSAGNKKGSHCIGLCGQVGWFGILYK